MAELLKGAPVAAAICARARKSADELALRGVRPMLAIVRVGERPDDLSYERGAKKRCAEAGVEVLSSVYPENVDAEVFFESLARLAADEHVHGILMFRPLPKHIDENRARSLIPSEKDVDGCTEASLSGVFTDSGDLFPPCTPQAVVEILDHYGIDCVGKNCLVMGRSLVVGKPAAMLLLKKNATVTVCHSKSRDTAALARAADIVVVCMGRSESVGREYFREGQVVIDVGIGVNAEGKLCGDVRFDEAEPVVAAVTPVPGGVGSVTTSVLVANVVKAAERRAG